MAQSKNNILIVDDDKRLCALLEQYLTGRNYHIYTAQSTSEARELLLQQQVDAIILDVMMPGQTGIEFTRELKEASVIPVLLLTAMSEVDDRIAGLESGADDYLTKPFEPRELSLRIENLLKRSNKIQPQNNRCVAFGQYIYNIQTCELFIKNNQQDISLSSNEQRLLTEFAKYLNQPVSRGQLSDKLNNVSERSIDVQINRLRKKIAPDSNQPSHLRTIRGQGYMLRGNQQG